MPYFVFGLIALLLALVAIQAFMRSSPAVLARNIRFGAGVAALGGALLMLVRGAASLAFPLAALGTWLLWKPSPGHRWDGGGSSPRADGSSGVTTEHLEMHLDHSSGAMEGRVLKGAFSGRWLSSLRPMELAELWREYRWTDPASAQLVEAYLDRSHPSWRDDMARTGSASESGRSNGHMTRSEALDILGLDESANADDIRQAHRTLMAKLHPDRGGSTYLAAKINQAKDVALGDD